MSDIIKLPQDADRAAFVPFVAADEFEGRIYETRNGAKHVTAPRDAQIIGKRVVWFEPVTEKIDPTIVRPSPKNSRFVGWRKRVSQFVIEGRGFAYNYDGVEVCNFYVREA